MAVLQIHVVPNASSDCVVGKQGGAIKIKLQAPAVEGKPMRRWCAFSPNK